MKSISCWLVVILALTGMLSTACGGSPSNTPKNAPSRLETVVGAEVKRVILTEKAAQRLDIQTASVENGVVRRTWVVGGETVANPLATPAGNPAPVAADPNDVWVQITLNASDLGKVDRAKAARILPAGADAAAPGLTAGEVVLPGGGDDEEDEEGMAALYYRANGAGQGFEPGQRVAVELQLAGNGVKRIVIPYAAVVYTPLGDTWVYTNPEPLVYVRRPIVVDYIAGDLAYLTVGPPTGTRVVTVGSAELYGAETGVSK